MNLNLLHSHRCLNIDLNSKKMRKENRLLLLMKYLCCIIWVGKKFDCEYFIVQAKESRIMHIFKDSLSFISNRYAIPMNFLIRLATGRSLSRRKIIKNVERRRNLIVWISLNCFNETLMSLFFVKRRTERHWGVEKSSRRAVRNSSSFTQMNETFI